MRYDPQEYDDTDVFGELVDDAGNWEGFEDWYYAACEASDISWSRVRKAFDWTGSLTWQWVEDVCTNRPDLVDDVHTHLVATAKGAFKLFIEAENYGHLKEDTAVDNLIALINIWEAEEVI